MIRTGPSALLTRIRARFGDERGFTLVEVLTVMIVISVLAALTYAVFLSQRSKAKDAEAKNNVAALAVQVESCRVNEEDDFTRCDTRSELDERSLPIDEAATLDSGCSSDPIIPPPVPPEQGQVAVVASAPDCYVILGQTDDGHFFWIRHAADGSRERRCMPPGQGSCHVDPVLPPTIGSWN